MTEFSPDALWRALSLDEAPPSRLLVAFSGGLDSTVLLYALHELRERLPPLAAIHVNHGLHPEAANWARHCESVCRTLGLPFELAEIHVGGRGESVEAAARDARYQAFRDILGAGDGVLTAPRMSRNAW